MGDCCVKGCTNRRSKLRKSKQQLELEKTTNISFHRIPCTVEKRKKWLEVLHLNENNLPKVVHICSLHFEEEMLDRTSLSCVRLKDGAIPCKFLDRHEIDSQADRHSDQQEFDGHSAKQMRFEEENQELPRSSETSKEIPEINCSDDRIADSINDAHSTTPVESQYILQDNTPRKEFLRRVLKNKTLFYRKKVKLLQQQNRRHTATITSLKKIINSIRKKNLMSDVELDVLDNLGMANAQLLKRQLLKTRNMHVPKQYSPELRQFALTLHYYSPRAYRFVRRKFNTCLPHPKTLTKWFQSVHAHPGFIREALESIKQRVEISNYSLVGALIFDEMAIRQHIEYDGKKFSGYIDMGPVMIMGDLITTLPI